MIEELIPKLVAVGLGALVGWLIARRTVARREVEAAAFVQEMEAHAAQFRAESARLQAEWVEMDAASRARADEIIRRMGEVPLADDPDNTDEADAPAGPALPPPAGRV